MKLALTCPDELLDMVQPFTDFDFILSDRYFKSEVYANWYRSSDSIKFVDNSVAETGEPCSIEELSQIAEDCSATYMFAPDWVGEYQKTIDAYEECIGRLPKDKVVGVLQGSSPEEALKCLDVYESKIVGVPARVGGYRDGDSKELMLLRRALVISRIPSDRIVHLLGFISLAELTWYTGLPSVYSLDTHAPVSTGLAVKDIDDYEREQKVKVDINKDSWAAICRNVALLRKYMS